MTIKTRNDMFHVEGEKYTKNMAVSCGFNDLKQGNVFRFNDIKDGK